MGHSAGDGAVGFSERSPRANSSLCPSRAIPMPMPACYLIAYP